MIHIKFRVVDPDIPVTEEWRTPDHPSPYINLQNPERDIRCLSDANEIVIEAASIFIHYDYPLRHPVTIQTNSPNGSSFTKAELIREISHTYEAIYEGEKNYIFSIGSKHSRSDRRSIYTAKSV